MRIIFTFFLFILFSQKLWAIDSEVLEKIKKLESLIERENQESRKVDLLIELSKEYEFYNIDSSLSYAEKAVNLSEKINNEISLVISLQNISDIYINTNKFYQALESVNKSVSLSYKLNIDTLMAKSFMVLGRVYADHSFYDKSLEYFNDAKEIYSKLNNNERLFNVCLNQCRVLELIRDKENYRKSITEAESLLSKFEGMENLSKLYIQKSSYFVFTRQFDSALYHLNIVDSIIHKYNFYKLKTRVYNLWGYYYFVSDDIEKALEFNSKNIQFKKAVNFEFPAKQIFNRGFLFFYQKKYDSSFKYLNSILEHEYEELPLQIVYNTHSVLSSIYEEKGNIEKAFYHFKEYNRYNDSVYNINANNKYALLRLEEEQTQKEKENIVLTQEIKTKNSLISVGIISTIVILLFTFALLIMYRKKRKLNFDLEEKSVQIETNNKELQELNEKIQLDKKELENLNSSLLKSEEELSKALQDKNKLFSIIANDLKGPFTGFIGLTDFLKESFDQISINEIKKIIKTLNKGSSDFFQLLNNLLEWSNSQSGKIKFNPESFDLSMILALNFDYLKSEAEKKNIEFTNEILNEQICYADRHMIDTVIKNLIKNAIKYSNAGDKIVVKTTKDSDHIKVSIEDTGIGMSQEILSKLFKSDEKITTPGTNNEKGTGLGLLISKDFVYKNNGIIWAESTENEGSKFHFTIPISAQ